MVLCFEKKRLRVDPDGVFSRLRGILYLGPDEKIACGFTGFFENEYHSIFV